MNTLKYDSPVYQRIPVGTKGRYKYEQVGAHVQFDLFSNGAHLLVVQDSCTSYLHNVDPAKAATLAAMKLAKEAMVKALQEASDYKPSERPITKEQRELLDKLQATGFNSCIWVRESTYGIVEAGLKVLEE